MHLCACIHVHSILPAIKGEFLTPRIPLDPLLVRPPPLFWKVHPPPLHRPHSFPALPSFERPLPSLAPLVLVWVISPHLVAFSLVEFAGTANRKAWPPPECQWALCGLLNGSNRCVCSGKRKLLLSRGSWVICQFGFLLSSCCFCY